MPSLKYHHGQLLIQEEAKTSHVASKLADWVGPVVEFALEADLFLLAAGSEGGLRFTVLSGEPPLLAASGQVQHRHGNGDAEEPGPLLRFPSHLLPAPPAPTPYGGLAINFATARRARLNGLLSPGDGATELRASETFTLCRKYIAPSLPRSREVHAGPVSREPLALDDAWLNALVAGSETAFLASVSPAGLPDISHRGGPAGFLKLDPAGAGLSWEEYVGDGVFKGAGNLRATGRFTLLVPDIESGDGVELVGRGQYTNLRVGRHERLDPLVQDHESFPVQGRISCRIEKAFRLHSLLNARTRLSAATAITSSSSVDEQAPQ
jgi:uncharacterized protein